VPSEEKRRDRLRRRRSAEENRRDRLRRREEIG
jgi:hypothetical protein